MADPDWFSAIRWSPPVPIETLRVQRRLLPTGPGVYCFTSYETPLERNFGVLYVGKAASLYTRVQSYLVDPGQLMVLSARSGGTRVTSSLRHPGKALLLMEVQQKYREQGHTQSFIWVRWTETDAPALLESRLIAYLQPKFNTQGRGED